MRSCRSQNSPSRRNSSSVKTRPAIINLKEFAKGVENNSGEQQAPQFIANRTYRIVVRCASRQSAAEDDPVADGLPVVRKASREMNEKRFV